MAIGPHKGTKVSEAKPKIRDEMVRAGQAVLYSEPERPVTSRSGDDCVVALTDQWYLTYGEDQWRDEALAGLARLDTFSGEARHAFEHTLGWLQQWACSRSFGLGTRLPWDEQFLVESLSDSTVYMAYYSVAHILQGGDMYGEGGAASYDAYRAGGGGAGGAGGSGSAIPAAAMTHEAWDYVFLGGAYPPGCAVPEETLARMRREFEYWYPFDLRVSGKDLIQNHLTFALYSHVAVWPRDRFPEKPEQRAQRERLALAAGARAPSAGGAAHSADELSSPGGRFWPRALRCNGHLLLNSEKMSKSTGNFKTLREAIAAYGSDATRWALADAGDGMDDANFETSTANAAILRLTKELAWLEETLLPPEERSAAAASGGGAAVEKAAHVPLREDGGEGGGDGGDGTTTVHDRVFANALAVACHRARLAYDRLLFREALKAAGYDLLNARDAYRFACGPLGMKRSLVRRYAEVSARLLAPVTPHTSDHIWRRVLRKPGSVLTAGWPGEDVLGKGNAEPDFVMERAAAYVEDLIPALRKSVAKAEAPAKGGSKGGKGAAPAAPAGPPPKVRSGTLYVAERYVGWQDAVLRAMRGAWDASKGALASDWAARVLEAVKEAGAGGGAGGGGAADEKRLKALALPFARFKAEEAARLAASGGAAAGAGALDAKLPFDEAGLLREYLPYLVRALGGELARLEVVVVDLADAASVAALPDPAKSAQPGAPAAVFSTEA
jgi:leucyl-tRNA synthetase